jgi:hypothetical protein
MSVARETYLLGADKFPYGVALNKKQVISTAQELIEKREYPCNECDKRGYL